MHLTTTTNITQDDLIAMEERINERNDTLKKDSDDALSTAISALSALSESQADATQATFLANLDSRWEKQELQIEQHTAQMASAMQNMQAMMLAMKTFVEAASNRSSSSESSSDSGISEDTPMKDDDSFDTCKETSDAKIIPEVRRSKRKSAKSPDLKRHSRNTGGRGSAAGRGKRSIRKNLENRYAPLAESYNAPLSGPE
jgi:hypothetical protein